MPPFLSMLCKTRWSNVSCRIRPLLTDDLKRRRLSGRHQISNGGKHLVDGIAFGRPWLHAPGDRPALDLPPRKRARITYDTDDGDDDSDDDDADWNEDEDADDDQDEKHSTSSPAEATGESSHNEDNDEELLSELKLLKQDRKDISDHSSEDGAGVEGGQDGQDVESGDNGDVGYGLLPTLDCVAALRVAFPLLPASRIEKELRRQGYDVREAYDELSSTFQASLSFDQMMDSAITGTTRVPGTPHFSEMESLPPTTPTRPLIQEIESLDATDDEQDSQDSTSSSGSSDDDSEISANELDGLGIAGNDSSLRNNKKSLVRPGIQLVSEERNESDSESDFDSSSELSSSSGSGGSSNSAESSIAEGSHNAGPIKNASSESDSDSSASSDSSSNDDSSDESASSPEMTLSKPKSTFKDAAMQQLMHAETPPGAGLTKTQKRNARRKRAKQMRLDAEQDGRDTKAPSNNTMADDLLARKAALLEVLNTEEPATELPAEELLAANASPAGGLNGAAAGECTNEKDSAKPQAQTNDNSSDSPRRMRVNLGAGRRLLFGALGLKNPKSKADEDKLRENLMKDVRPHTNSRLIQEVQESDPPPGTAMDESWREKINYRAVECCHDGIVLSEPPFPFVQRWDPQQQYNAMRKRKRQSEQSYYDDYEDYAEDDSYVEPERQGSRKKAKGKSRQSVELGAGLATASNGVLGKDAAARSSPTTDTEDLPSLPADVAALPALADGAAKPGMVITWKHLAMSKATNWQPQITPVTGLIVSSDEADLHIILAKRDREVSDKLYDEYTGKRIYEKFEAPGSDDEDEEEDDGHRTLAWQELMDPRMVQGEPPTGFMDGINGHAGKTAVTEVSDQDCGNGGVGAERDTQTLRAEVQNEVAQIGNGDGEDSASIHSAQRPHHFDMPGLADDGLISVASDSWETSKAANPDDGRTSRLKEVAMASQSSSNFSDRRQGTAADKAPAAKSPSRKSTLNRGTKRTGARATAADIPAASEEEDGGAVIPSSLHEDDSMSGANGEMTDLMPALNDDLISETLPRGMEATAAEQDWIANGAASRSSSPFPSLEEIFLTASSSREPPQSMPTTRAEVNKHADQEYEEAMRQLDNGEASDSPGDDEPQKLFPNATQPPARSTIAVELPMGPPEPRSSPRGKRKATTGNNKQYVVPEGSQVITLSSSPPFREEAAMDGEDETFTPTRGNRRKQAGASQRAKANGGPAMQTRRGSSSVRRSGSESLDGEGSQRAKLRRRSSVTK